MKSPAHEPYDGSPPWQQGGRPQRAPDTRGGRALSTPPRWDGRDRPEHLSILFCDPGRDHFTVGGRGSTRGAPRPPTLRVSESTQHRTRVAGCGVSPAALAHEQVSVSAEAPRGSHREKQLELSWGSLFFHLIEIRTMPCGRVLSFSLDVERTKLCFTQFLFFV